MLSVPAPRTYRSTPEHAAAVHSGRQSRSVYVPPRANLAPRPRRLPARFLTRGHHERRAAMRLLDAQSFCGPFDAAGPWRVAQPAEFFGPDVPPYAVLSHTWGAVARELKFGDFGTGVRPQERDLEKISMCAQKARDDGLAWIWVDTCCIDKASSAELAEAISSMYTYYSRAKKCYVFLADVTDRNSMDQLRKSRWFTRGWTLQELLAPKTVEFYTASSELIGTRETMVQEIHEITGISLNVLRGAPISNFSVSERMRWAAARQTTREEDSIYCLLGIFDVSMPVIYGEGRDRAMIRLRREIEQTHGEDVEEHEPTGVDLHNAVRDDRIDLVRSLIGRGVSVDYVRPGENAEPVLHTAIRSNSDRMVGLILEAEPMVDAYNEEGLTALMLATIEGSLKNVRKLLDADCMVDIRLRRSRRGGIDSSMDLESEFSERIGNSTALFLAAVNNRTKIMGLLLDKGASVNAQASHGFTALHAAVIKGNLGCVKLLLKHGADVETRGNDGKRALHYACSFGWKDVGAALLDAGASMEAKKAGGMTPLLEAGWCSRTAMCEFMLNRGANINAQTTWSGDYEGWTCLHLAVDNDNPRMAQILLQKGADATINATDGGTPEEKAKREGRVELVRILASASWTHIQEDEYAPIDAESKKARWRDSISRNETKSETRDVEGGAEANSSGTA